MENNPLASSEEQHAAAVDLLTDDQYSKYVLLGKTEILQILKSLVSTVAQITMFFNSGKDMVLTSLAAVSDKGIFLDFGPSSEMNRKALLCDKLFCVTQLDKVKVQFVLKGLREEKHDGRPAFRASLPESVLRLQRREFFRLAMPVTRPLRCAFVLPVAGSPIKMESNVGDVSGGGLGLVGLADDLQLDIGMELKNVRLDLPEVGVVSGTLKVCSVARVINRSGIPTKRAGCEFISLPGPMLTLLQRYIIKIERERKARESGL